MSLFSRLYACKTLGVATRIALTVLVLSTQASAASYTLTMFSFPGASTDGGKIFNGTAYGGINNTGVIVGSFYDASSVAHGFVQIGATYATFDVPGAINTSASAVNDAGQIVGSFSDSLGSHGFIYDGTTYITIDVPSASQGMTQVFGINNAGQIVGVFYNSSGRHGFLYDGTTYTILDHGSEIGMFADGINDAGVVVGWFFDNTFLAHGFVYHDSTYTSFDEPDVLPYGSNTVTGSFITETAGWGINSAGEVVGFFDENLTSVYNDVEDVGFLKNGETYTEFAVPGATSTELYGINDAGEIVGSIVAGTGYGVSYGILAAPISLLTQISARGTDLMQVTIFGSGTLGVATLDPTALRLGPKQASPDPDFADPSLIEDVNGDGLPDLVVLFRYKDTGLSSAASHACFTGSMTGQTFLACDPIVEIPSCGLGCEPALILPALLLLRGRRRRKPVY